MGVFLSVHALGQMQDRGISRDEVEQALKAANRTAYRSGGAGDTTVILSQTGGGRRLKVVVLASDPDYVITVAGRDEED